MADVTQDAESGVAVWIALHRAHEGGIANLQGHWLDSGSRVPGYVADALDALDALDGLVSAGLLAWGGEDPESCHALRVIVTDTGCARYVALCQVHGPRARVAVGIPYRWARSPRDQRSHLLAQCDTDQIRGQVAVCGQRLWWSVAMSAQPTGRPCLTCEALPGVLVPASRFDSPPDSGRPPVEQLPWPRGHQPASR